MKNTSIKKHKGFEYIKLKHNKAMITKYSGEEQELSIPARLSWHKVTSIANEAFMGCTALTSITIPDSITDIGEGAFRDCTALTSITIPKSV